MTAAATTVRPTAPVPPPASTAAKPATTEARPVGKDGDAPADAPKAVALPAGALSAADVKALRERLDRVILDGAAPDRTIAAPADRIVSLVAGRVAEARAADLARLADLEQALDTLRKHADQGAAGLRESLAAAVQATDVALAELGSAREQQKAIADELAKANRALARAEARIAELTAKPAADASQPVGAEALAELVDSFVTSLGDRLGTLTLAGGEIVLKTAVAPTATGARFVLPSATGPAPAVLQELRLRLEPRS